MEKKKVRKIFPKTIGVKPKSMSQDTHLLLQCSNPHLTSLTTEEERNILHHNSHN